MLSYKIEGHGPPLLLIHGWGVTFNIWQNLAPLLQSDHTLIMIELPGLGASQGADPRQDYYVDCAAAIQHLREKLNIDQWAVLSYSSGTRAGEAYVQRDAVHVSRAIFLCPALLNRWRSLGLGVLIQVDQRWPGVGNWLLSDWRLYGLVVWLGFNGQLHPFAADWSREISSQPVAILKATLYDLPLLGRRPFETPISQTMFVWGRHDLIPARPRRLRPNDRVIVANHSAPQLAAPAVAQTVLQFLQ